MPKTKLKDRVVCVCAYLCVCSIKCVRVYGRAGGVEIRPWGEVVEARCGIKSAMSVRKEKNMRKEGEYQRVRS